MPTRNIKTLRLPALNRLFAPVDIAFLVYFRIAFGVIMLWEVWRYFIYGWIKRYFIDPTFYFTYYGFDWVKPWAGNGMYIHLCILGNLAILIFLGLGYRVASILFFLGFTYVFLLDQTNYLNHFYFVSLISFLMIFLPAHRAFSLDALRSPKLRTDTCPAWTLWLLRIQVGIVYFYGGLAKFNGDWLHAWPLRIWLAERANYPLIGHFMTQEWVAYFFSYTGLLIDLLIVPLLIWKRTRIAACVFAIMFHLMNAWLFKIGIFPWFMIAATLLFFSPSWPRRLLSWIRWPVAPAPQIPVVPKPCHTLQPRQWLPLVLLGVYLAFQFLFPFRHFLYPGDVHWTEEGHRFSWRMKLRNKTGKAQFLAIDPITKQTWEVAPREYLTRRQVKKISDWPDMVLQFAHYLARHFQSKGYPQIEIYTNVMVSLNGRKPQLLIDPTYNLAQERRTLWPAKWILPLKEPLPKKYILKKKGNK